jgi:hypothetical protein
VRDDVGHLRTPLQLDVRWVPHKQGRSDDHVVTVVSGPAGSRLEATVALS